MYSNWLQPDLFHSCRNRAVHGDIVVVELLHKSQWKGRSVSLKSKDEGKIMNYVQQFYCHVQLWCIHLYRSSIEDREYNLGRWLLTHWLLCQPKPAVTRLKSWCLFHFWHYHTCDQNWHHRYSSSNDTQISDRLSGAWNTHVKAQKFEWGTRSKNACDYMWLLHGKICLSWWCFLRIFWTGSKPSRRSITAAKRWG